jgi:hypothetical protein
MWFRRDTTDTTQFRRAVWDIGKWIILGPAIGGLGLLVFALLIGVRPENLMNAVIWGAAFGMMGGVSVAGTKWMSRWKV